MIDKDKVMTLVTVDYDEADRALDKLAFVRCAIAAMMDNHQDNIVNGLVGILEDATEEIRQYMESARATLLQIESEQGETESAQR